MARWSTCVLTLVAFACRGDVSQFDARIAADRSQSDTNGLEWVDGTALPLESRGFDNTWRPYARMPKDLLPQCSPGVRNMSGHATGHYLLFETDSKRIAVEWVVKERMARDPYIPPQGLYGVDIYSKASGQWRFVRNGRLSPGDSLTNMVCVGISGDGMRPVLVYLPTRAVVLGLRVGVDAGARIERHRHPSGIVRPIVHYGTSIVHGGCASRPGLCFTSIVGRTVDAPYVNLGFSGQAHLEPVMAEAMARIDASLYLVDPVWNCSPEMVRERLEPFLRKLHAARPDVPILLCEAVEPFESRQRSNPACRAVYDRLVAEKSSLSARLHYLPADGMIQKDGESTHDYCHPNDYGSVQMGKVFSKAILRILRPESERPILVINEDNDHYFKQSSDLMNEASLREYAADIFRGPVTHFFMCAQGQRASYDSKVWEPIWKGLDDPDVKGVTSNIWCVNAKKLFDAGIDPYRVWISCAREKGVSPWMTMRMNDIHFCTTTNYFRNTTFFKAHPEWRCVPGIMRGDWDKFCMDYAVREVYDYHLAMAKELIDRYDVDGIELDFLRAPGYVRVGSRRSKADVLTAFIRDVRIHAEAVGRRRGRKILVGARVPALPVVCATSGMDVETWAQKRLIDWLVVCNQYWCADFALPFAEWRDRMAAVNPDLVLLPGCDVMIGRNERESEMMTPALYRGWADGLYAQGAKGLYLFNVPYGKKDVRDAVYGEGLSPEVAAKGSRRCPATRHDVMPKGGIGQATLPLDLGCDRLIPLTLGTVPKRTGEVWLVFDRDDPALKNLMVRLNGESACRAPQKVPADAVKWVGGKSALAFAFDPVAFVPRENGVLIDALPQSEAKVVWCEFRLPAVE